MDSIYEALGLITLALLLFISHAAVQQFVHNCFIHAGSVVFLAIVLLQGLWEHNRMHGQGIYTDSESHQWSGQFFNGSGPGLISLL